MSDLVTRLEARAQAIPQEVADRENACSACCGAYGKDTWDDYSDNIDRMLMLECVTELSQSHCRIEALEAQLAALTKDNTALKQRATDAESDRDGNRDLYLEYGAHIAALREIISLIPGALNSAFSAGAEEGEGGSARRQEKLMTRYEGLRGKAKAALTDTAAAAREWEARVRIEAMEEAAAILIAKKYPDDDLDGYEPLWNGAMDKGADAIRAAAEEAKG